MKTDVVENFLIKADHDIEAASLLFKNNPLFTDTITYHCQQAVEKYLKAFLTFHKIRIKSNHELVDIINECINLDKEFEKFLTKEFYQLDDIGMSVRYSDIICDPSQEETSSYISLTENMRTFIKLKLNKN